METLREEVNTKLSHILHDIKDLQKTIFHLRREEKGLEKSAFQNGLLWEKKYPGNGKGPQQ